MMARTMGAEEDEGMVLNETLEEADAAAAAAAAAARGQAMPELAPVEDDDWAMPEPRSASPPARTGKKRDGDECSDLEELQPPPAKLPAVRARPVAKPKANGSWPCMSSLVWGDGVE